MRTRETVYSIVYKHQKREELQISKKLSNVTENNITVLSNDLETLLLYIFNSILKNVKDNNSLYIVDVEQIAKSYTDELNDILLNNIHDYYLDVSHLSEDRINNLYNQSELIKKYFKKSDKRDWQSPLDKWLKLDKPLRRAKNIQNSINGLTNKFPIHLTNYSYEELLQYQIDEAVVDYMTKEVFTASQSTLERVTQKVYDIIKEEYANQGEGVTQVTTAINDEFTELARYEAERIARTETLKAQGSANYARLRNNPTVEYKQWLATDDERTRDSHREINGQITTIDGVFENGLEFPGDTNGLLEEWINCRCDMVAYYPEIGYVAPDKEYWFESDMVYNPSDMDMYFKDIAVVIE